MSDMSGKTVVITGATSGIGLETAVQLARRNARLVLVGRDAHKSDAALATIRQSAPGAQIDIHIADLARLSEMQRLAQVLGGLPRIDVLINNAGALFRRREVTEDGLERTFALNHMAYFVLTELLRPRLAASAPARIVNVASEAHRGQSLDFDDLQNARDYRPTRAYGRSKLCNILFTRELAKKLAGSGVTANSLHPGFVASRFGHENGGIYGLGIRVVQRLFAISVADGAKTSVHVGSAPELATTSGGYFDKCAPTTPTEAARNDADAVRLWEASARLAGLPG